MKTLLLAMVAALVPAPPAPRPIQVDDVVQLRQIPETRISPDGKHVAFIVNEPSIAENKTVSRLMVDTRSVLTLDRITNISWAPGGQITFLTALDGADEVWSVPASGGKPRKLFNGPSAAVPIGGQRLAFRDARTPPHDAKVLRHEWSHDGHKLVFVVPQLVTPSSVIYDEKTLGIQSITAGQYGTPKAGIWVYEKGSARHVLDLDLGAQGVLGPRVTWSPDDTRLELDFNRKTTVVDARTGQIVDVPPTEQPRPSRPSTDTFTAWSFDATGKTAAAVRENSSTPPRVVLLNGPDIRDVYNPNSSVPAVQPSIPMEWTDSHGHKARGFRIVPPGCQRCPAIVITHGFDAQANTFMWDGFEWQYPSQVFAARGYVVLGVAESTDGDMLDPVAMMEAAVKSGVDDGTIDPARVGIAGYSRGADVTQLAISHSTVFKAASSGEGGNGTVGYWLFGAQTPNATEEAKAVFGGSPVDPNAVEKWRAYAPDLRADKINTPLLMQDAENNSIANMELRAYIRARDIPAELAIFPNETHLFHKPADRVTAMNQNLDWFDYWLSNRRDPNPAKKDQYTRWDTMRSAWHPN